MADFAKRIVLASGFGNLEPDVELLLDDDFVNSLRREPFQGVEACFLHSGRIIADKARELINGSKCKYRKYIDGFTKERHP